MYSADDISNQKHLPSHLWLESVRNLKKPDEPKAEEAEKPERHPLQFHFVTPFYTKKILIAFPSLNRLDEDQPTAIVAAPNFELPPAKPENVEFFPPLFLIFLYFPHPFWRRKESSGINQPPLCLRFSNAHLLIKPPL